jgi:TonB family protein
MSRKSLCLFFLSLSSCLPAQTPQRVRTPIGDTLTKALANSSLTAAGSQPFHIKLQIRDVIDSSSDYHAEIEEYWSSPTLWKRIVTAPNLRQVTTVNDSGTHIETTGDYFPLWLRAFVTAITNPVPTRIWNDPEIHLEQTLLPSGAKSAPCSNVEVQFGEVSAPSSLCFFLTGRISGVDLPGYEMEFNEYDSFKGKQVPHLYISEIEPSAFIVGKIERLEISNKKADFFGTPQPSNDSDPLSSIRIPTSQLRRMAKAPFPIEWPAVHSGKSEGSIIVFVSVDTHGEVREASIVHSDNPELNQIALDQLRQLKCVPAVSKGIPTQVEGLLVFPFSTRTDQATNTSATALSVPGAITAGRAISQAKPEYPAIAKWQHIRGPVYLRGVIGKDGSIKQLGVIDAPSPILADAALEAVRQWRYQPYLLNGDPVEVSTTITVNFNIGP